MAYLDIQNIYNFESELPENVTRLEDENGNPIVITDGNGVERYQLKTLKNLTGTVLPSIGIIFEF